MVKRISITLPEELYVEIKDRAKKNSRKISNEIARCVMLQYEELKAHDTIEVMGAGESDTPVTIPDISYHLSK